MAKTQAKKKCQRRASARDVFAGRVAQAGKARGSMVSSSLEAPSTPVVLLTGFGDLMNAAGEKPDGVDLVVKKPIRLSTLREVLAKMTEGPSAADAPAPATAR